jgi:hypothetical protein
MKIIVGGDNVNKYTLENERYLQRLNELKSYGYPDCSLIPMNKTEIKNLKIGTTCYVISQAGLHLRMYLGKNGDTKIIFAGSTGSFSYKIDNICKTYNVFLAKI